MGGRLRQAADPLHEVSPANFSVRARAAWPRRRSRTPRRMTTSRRAARTAPPSTLCWSSEQRTMAEADRARGDDRAGIAGSSSGRRRKSGAAGCGPRRPTGSQPSPSARPRARQGPHRRLPQTGPRWRAVDRDEARRLLSSGVRAYSHCQQEVHLRRHPRHGACPRRPRAGHRSQRHCRHWRDHRSFVTEPESACGGSDPAGSRDSRGSGTPPGPRRERIRRGSCGGGSRPARTSAGRAHVRFGLTLHFDHIFTICRCWRGGKCPASSPARVRVPLTAPAR
ncbi:hypothetical protein SGLAM104S_04856 [Streptomyces glaucescens]